MISFVKAQHDINYITGNMPYPQHVDEYHVVINGINMINNNNLYPGILVYPSLPIYICSSIIYCSNFIENLFKSNSTLEKLDNQNYPFFKEYIPILSTKLFVYFLSILTMFLISMVALKLSNCYISSIMCFILTAFSQLFVYQSRDYINIDLFATFFVTVNIFFFVYFFHNNISNYTLIIAGILTGLTISSKYPHGLIILMYISSIILFNKDSFLKKIFYSLIIFLTSILTTLICCPYIFIFFEKWLSEIFRQRQIYKNGWPGYTVDSGLTHFFLQIKQLFLEFGGFVFLLSIAGIFFLIKYKRKISIPIFFYFFIFISYFSNHSINFTRNLLPQYILYALFASFGFSFILKYFSRFTHSSIILFVLLSLTFITFPYENAKRIFISGNETRNVLHEFINTSLPKGAKIFISKEIGFDISELDDYNIREIKFLNEDKKTLNSSIAKIANSNDFFVYPVFCTDMRWPDGIHFATSINQSINGLKSLLHIQGRVGGSHSYIHLSRPGIQVNSSPPSPWGNPSIIVSKGLKISL